MASIDWPSSLPAPNADNFGFEAKGRGVIFRRDRSFRQARQRQGRRVFVYPATWTFTPDEFETFSTFFRTTLSNGRLLFNIDLINGELVESHEVSFDEARFTHTVGAGLTYRVAGKLLCESPPIYTEYDVDKYLEIWSPFLTNGNEHFLTTGNQPFLVRQ